MTQPSMPEDNDVTRRAFLRTTAGGSAALITGALGSFLPNSATLARRRRRHRPRPTSTPTPAPTPTPSPAAPAAIIEDATIPELQGFLGSGAVTSQGLVAHYQQRISSLNPVLHAVIELNP